MESNPANSDTYAANVVILTCIFYTSVIFIVSMTIKLLLRMCQERLTFVCDLDDVKYHITSFFMETVEITEQYCYTMNVAIVARLYNTSGKTIVVILLKIICNYLTKLTTNSCAYHVFRTNLVFVVYHLGPIASLAANKLYGLITEYYRRENHTPPFHHLTNGSDNDCSRCTLLRQTIRQDLHEGVKVLRSTAALIMSSYFSHKFMMTLWSADVFNTKETFLRNRCSVRNLKHSNPLKAAFDEAVITFMFLAMQIGLRNVCRCFRISKNLLTSAGLMYINMAAFRYTGVLMNPTYATAVVYGCQEKIDRYHFIVFWIGPIVGALVFKDIIWIIRALDYVQKVFRASVEELHHFGTLKTLCALIDDTAEYQQQKNKQKEDQQCRLKNNEPILCQRLVSNDKLFVLDYISSGEKLQLLKEEEEEIDSIIEKCTENGERVVMRRETEKKYVGKWEKARVEHFKLTFKAKELELQKEILGLQTRLENEQVIDKENETFLNYSINELKKQIEYWECKYKTDVMEIDNKLDNRMMTLKEKTKEVEIMKETYNERQNIIEEHTKNKKILEEEKKINDYREKTAIKIQAWWRGTMVRRRLGHYKNLLGPRKKSIKKPFVNKGKKSKSK
ncbi:uncharacterized protein LOC112692490 [Sipha flava]|uniref:Dynein regulatory complex protein 9 n=1 Tax=Sipha flava TaxID=143950 RepID=A0A8B8GK24_9HEMI|nr:uncharacterized protein LOC112692490 [Sipha flava]